MSKVNLYFTTDVIMAFLHVLEKYEDRSFNVTFSSGMINVTHDFSISIDGLLKVNDTLKFIIDQLSLPSKVTIGDHGNATVIILDNDSK